ncbi:MAG TPA: phosphoribosylanthranilate isomerase, partial [bacterium]|nr:phosphoribosylanthranilate isomerase [bacterium]
MRIKICGITRIEDALMAGNLGAWAVGFIFAPSSSRRLSPEKAREISECVKRHYPDLLRIGV